MYIGEFAKLCGVSTKTVRYYEQYGLLPEPTRQGSYRIYDDTYVETIKQIQLALSFDFTLQELAQMIEGHNIQRGLPRDVLLQAIAQKQHTLQTKMQSLQDKLHKLEQLQAQLIDHPCA